MGAAAGPDIVTDGLVLCLDAADEKSYSGSGTTWYDRSGNGNNGNLVNGVGYSEDNLGSLSFDGVDDYCRISNASVLNSIGDGDFTVSIWIYRATNPPYGNGEMLYQSSDTNNGIVICVSNTSFRIELRDRQSTNNTNGSVGGIFTAGIWNNVVLSKSGTTYKGYSQGIYRGQFTSYQDVSTTTGFVDIGRVSWWGPSCWEGNINVVKVYNRALTDSEIKQNYNALKGRFNL
jgi:hypothetical protein